MRLEGWINAYNEGTSMGGEAQDRMKLRWMGQWLETIEGRLAAWQGRER